MYEIGNRKVTHEQSSQIIDWKLIAEVIANEYIKSLQGGRNDERAMEERVKEISKG